MSASIQIIKDIIGHPNAESLSIAKVLGWDVCVKKNEFSKGQKCVYIEIDSIVKERAEFEFLRNKQFRIRPIRLRGEISQGICFKLDTFSLSEELEVGTDVSNIVGSKHYEKPLNPQLAGKCKGGLPHWLIRTDEPQIKKFPEVIEEFKGKYSILTLKWDGSSCNCYLKGEIFGVCSRNLEIIEDQSNSFWKMARKYKIEEALRSFRAVYPGDYSINFELCGVGVQGNTGKLDELSIRVFNLFSISKRKYAHYESLLEFCIENNLPIAEVVWAGRFNFTLEELVKMANESKYPSGEDAEGLILRPIEEQESKTLKGRMSVKILSETYSLKHGE